MIVFYEIADSQKPSIYRKQKPRNILSLETRFRETGVSRTVNNTKYFNNIE